MSSKPGLTGSESGIQIVERPKLNLKPRSQPIEQLEGNIEKERSVYVCGLKINVILFYCFTDVYSYYC